MAVVRFRAVDAATFPERARTALVALAARPGYAGGWCGPATDDPGAWVLVTRWGSVGEYRRALSAYEVKLAAHPLLYEAVDEPTAFEDVVVVEPGGRVIEADSDRTPPGAGRPALEVPGRRPSTGAVPLPIRGGAASGIEAPEA